MGYLALAVICSLLIGVLFKRAAQLGQSRVHLLAVNYVVAAVGAALAIRGPVGLLQASPGLWAYGIAVGVLFLVGFLLFARATAESGMALAISAMRISVAIPFVGSWLIWNDPAGAAQWTGLALAGGALVLITRPDREAGEQSGRVANAAAGLTLILLFVAGGVVDLSLKAYDVAYAGGVDSDVFITLIFGSAFVSAVFWILVRPAVRRWPDRSELGWGIVLGLVNYGSIWFLLEAVARIPGTIVFPTNSVLIVLGGAVLGTTIWKERLSRVNWLGLALAMIALLLLNWGQ